MFEKQRQAMNNNVQYQKVKLHVEKNKRVYIAGASCFVVGTVGMKLANLTSSTDVIQTISGNDNVATIVNRSKNVDVIIKYLNQRNYPANPVQCLETLEKWGSQAEAAVAKGLTDSCLSQHLNGHRAHAGGLHFVRL